MRATWIGMMVATAVAVTNVASAQTSRSASSAERVAKALRDRKMQHAAAADASEAGVTQQPCSSATGTCSS